MISRLALTALGGTLVLAACQSPMETDTVSRLLEPEAQILRAADGPPGADPESCWARDITPAVIETVTEQIMVQPAQITADGQITSPAVFKTETQQRIARERTETWFETPCPEVMTPDFVATLQRALAARGLYRGAVSGDMDRATRRAVRRYQASEGLDSGTISLAAARQLGLVAVDPATLEADG